MTRTPDPPCRIVRRIAPVLGMVLLVGVFAGIMPHHDDGPGHFCAVCAAGHSPAIAEAIPSPAKPPAGPREELPGVATSPPRPARLETASSRAPPRP